MEQTRTMWGIGGDGRMPYAYGRLQTLAGWRLETSGAPGAYDALVLPAPATRDGTYIMGTEIPLSRLLPNGKDGALVLGGMLSPDWIAQIRAAGQIPVDYFTQERLVLQNALATAEGAVQIAMERLDITLAGSRGVVVGSGRIALALAPRLRAMGCGVVVCARSGAGCGKAALLGVGAAPLSRLADYCKDADFLINTVPAPVIGADALAALSQDALVIDLASPPGGVDRAAAKALGVTHVWALSLPPQGWQGHKPHLDETEKTRPIYRVKLCKL